MVVGSYERGDHAVTVARLAELAEFYGVPLAELLPDSGAAGSEARGRLVIDLVRLGSVDDPEAAPLARFTASIQAQRGDYNNKVLTIRSEDLRALAVIYDQAPANWPSGWSDGACWPRRSFAAKADLHQIDSAMSGGIQ